MGLEEKRKQKEFETNVLPKFKSDVENAVGKKVDIEIDWEPFYQGYGHCIEGMSAAPEEILQALNRIAADSLGKEALQAGLKKIKLEHNESAVSVMEFSGGTLLIKHFWAGGGVGADYIESEIMGKL